MPIFEKITLRLLTRTRRRHLLDGATSIEGCLPEAYWMVGRGAEARGYQGVAPFLGRHRGSACAALRPHSRATESCGWIDLAPRKPRPVMKCGPGRQMPQVERREARVPIARHAGSRSQAVPACSRKACLPALARRGRLSALRSPHSGATRMDMVLAAPSMTRRRARAPQTTGR